MEQIRTFPCLYDKSKMSYKEPEVSRNACSHDLLYNRPCYIAGHDGVKLQKSWISCKMVYTNVYMKNLQCISSGKEWKS